MSAKSPGSRSVGAIVDGRYSLEKVIGSGAMGVVYLARDLNLDRMLALKLIARELAQDSTTIARFRREAQALATIKHQHVVHVYAYGPHDGAYFFAMEFIDGETVDQLMIAYQQRVPRDQVHAILRAVASGLGAVHEKGIVHRDVKPGNIVIETTTNRPVLVDFGLAANARPTDGRTSFVGGTPYYMAPEQITAGEEGATPPGPAADQYALACMAFELLSGRPPFEHENVTAILAGHINRPPPFLSELEPDLAAMDAPLQRAMSKRPEDRFGSCEEFIAALEPAFGKVTAPVFSSPRPSAARLVLADVTDRGGPNPTLDPAALHASLPKKSSSWLFLLGGVIVAVVGMLSYAGVRSREHADATPADSQTAQTASPNATAIPPPPAPAALETSAAISVSALPTASAIAALSVAKPVPRNLPFSHPTAPLVNGTTTTAPTAAPVPSAKPKGAYDDFGERK